jgi:thiol-disulfide isomerase/thioredoxin
MAETLSTMIPLETIAPPFSLPDVSTDKIVSLSDSPKSIATVIMFICNHCPYVKHIQNKLLEIANTYQQKGVRFIAINSNDVKAYPADHPQEMKKIAREKNYPFPYLFDESQTVAKAYHAACTPDFYVFDDELKCIYRGRFDGATPGNGIPVTGQDLSQALDALLAKKPINLDQKQSVGCNIKWKV